MRVQHLQHLRMSLIIGDNVIMSIVEDKTVGGSLTRRGSIVVIMGRGDTSSMRHGIVFN